MVFLPFLNFRIAHSATLGGYIMSGVEDNNLDNEKLVNIWWTGVKYTLRNKTDFTFAW